MKNLVKFAAFFFIAVVVFAACKKEKVVTPPPITNMNLIPVGALSINRSYSAATSAGNKILFAGGHGEGTSLSTRVDIYDMITQAWSTAELSEARTGIGAVSVGNKILFAGGAKNFNYDDGWYNLSTRVDIYDVSTNSFTTTELPDPINFLWWEGITVAAGNKAFFCGGNMRDRVYIYDVVTNSWSTAQLSENRNSFVAASLGNKILIAGGKNVDIYDMSSQTWSTAELSDERRFMRAGTLNNKAFFAGGEPFSDKIDIYDNATQSWSIASLSKATILAGAAPFGQMLLFFGGTHVDIYDSSLDSWSVSELDQSFSDGSVILSAGGNIYLTKGNEVWRVQ